MSVQSRARNGAGSQPSQQMGAAELGSSSQRCVCVVPRQKWHWHTAISTDGSCRSRFEPSQQMGAAELGSSSQRCVCAVPRQKFWLTAISTDGSCRTRFELSEMSVQSRARNGTGSQPSQQMGAAELGSSSQRCQQMGAAELGSSSQRCVCAVPRQKWHWLTAISTDGSCRTRFELSEMCLCSPAPEMALAHSHLNRWELPN